MTVVYFNGRFMPKEEVCVSPDDRGFLFADGVYEVIAAHDGELFMADAHYKRLSRSLSALRIPEPTLEVLQPAVASLLGRNGLDRGGAKLYIQITRGVAHRNHAFPDDPVPPTVYAEAEPYTPPEELWQRGVHAILVPDIRWARCDIKSLALLPNVLASQRAKEAGAYDAIFVRDGVITEGAHTSVCAVFGGRLVTHPRTHHILGGVTRDVVLDLCRKGGIPVRERPILEEELGDADEVMLLGTTTGVMPVVSVDHLTIGDGHPGPITLTLQSQLRALMMGES
ncbi:MAG: D-amino-acid transaminase [Anaerolineae bacterium]